MSAERQPQRRCAACGKLIDREVLICPYCDDRRKLELQLERTRDMAMECPNCGAENPDGKKFCGECGEILRGEFPSSTRGKVRIWYVVGGGFTAALFFGLFYWASTFTYTERVWHEIVLGYGYWETVTHHIDPAIQALLLVAAIVGLVAMVFGVVSRK